MDNDDLTRLNTPPFSSESQGRTSAPSDNGGYAAGFPRTGPESGPAFVPHTNTNDWYGNYASPPGAGMPPVAAAPAPGRPRRRAGALIVAAALSAIIGAGTGIGSYAYVTQAESANVPISVTTSPASATAVLDGTVAAAAAKIEPSVVTITVQSGQSGDIGTGVILDKKGHILTNFHVVEAASPNGKITVTLSDGRTAEATVVGNSTSNDLAVIKVDGISGLTPATFAKSGSLKVGQSVVAAGAPLGLSETITSGIVSNTARPVRSGVDNDAVYLAVQTDTAINPGNSGGPLVDLNGSVVGINSSIASTGSSQSQGSQSGSIGIGFAIPADVAVRVSAGIIATGKSTEAAMGVSVGGSDSTGTTSTGVQLQGVTADGAAAKAGLQAGDVVTKVNDFSTTSADGLIAATRFYAPGTNVNVTYLRNGASDQTTVTLSSK